MSFEIWRLRSKLLGDAVRNTEKYKSHEIEKACKSAYMSGYTEGREISIKQYEQALNKIAEKTSSEDPCRHLVDIARSVLKGVKK